MYALNKYNLNPVTLQWHKVNVNHSFGSSFNVVFNNKTKYKT